MQIQTVFSNTHSYDVRSCYYSMLSGIHWGIQDVNIFNKTERNVSIGNIQKSNVGLPSSLARSVDSIIYNYIQINNLNLSDIIIKQRDGFISKQKITVFDNSMPIAYKGLINKLIYGNTKNKFIMIGCDGSVSVKGITKPYDPSIFNSFKSLDFNNYKNFICGVERLRRIFYTENNMLWHVYMRNGVYSVKLLNGTYVKIPVANLSSGYMDTSFIDKNEGWMVIWTFIKNILETIRS